MGVVENSGYWYDEPKEGVSKYSLLKNVAVKVCAAELGLRQQPKRKKQKRDTKKKWTREEKADVVLLQKQSLKELRCCFFLLPVLLPRRSMPPNQPQNRFLTVFHVLD